MSRFMPLREIDPDPDMMREFSAEEAVSILCRVVARWAHEIGSEGDAQAALKAEAILRLLMQQRSNLCAKCCEPISTASPNDKSPR